MSPSEESQTAPRFADAEPGPFKSKPTACACAVFVFASILGVVMVILILPGVMMRLATTTRQKTLIEIVKIRSALEEYSRANQGSFPRSLEELRDLRIDGRRALSGRDDLRDPWGREYVYEPPNETHAAPRVYSLGRDGKRGGRGDDADIDSLEFHSEP